MATTDRFKKPPKQNFYTTEHSLRSSAYLLKTSRANKTISLSYTCSEVEWGEYLEQKRTWTFATSTLVNFFFFFF